MTPQVNEYWLCKSNGRQYRIMHKVKIKYNGIWVDGFAYHEKHIKDAPVYVRELSDFIDKFELVA